MTLRCNDKRSQLFGNVSLLTEDESTQTSSQSSRYSLANKKNLKSISRLPQYPTKSFFKRSLKKKKRIRSLNKSSCSSDETSKVTSFKSIESSNQNSTDDEEKTSYLVSILDN